MPEVLGPKLSILRACWWFSLLWYR